MVIHLVGDFLDADGSLYILRIKISWIDTLLLVVLALYFLVEQFDYPHRWLMRTVIGVTLLLIPPVFFGVCFHHVDYAIHQNARAGR